MKIIAFIAVVVVLLAGLSLRLWYCCSGLSDGGIIAVEVLAVKHDLE